jgi:hypothetical protein
MEEVENMTQGCYLVLTFLLVSPASFFSLNGIKVPQGNGIPENKIGYNLTLPAQQW